MPQTPQLCVQSESLLPGVSDHSGQVTFTGNKQGYILKGNYRSTIPPIKQGLRLYFV